MVTAQGRNRDVGAAIRGARAAKRMTQAELGRETGYSASAVSRIEIGEMRPSPHSLLRFEDVLEIDLGARKTGDPPRVLESQRAPTASSGAIVAGRMPDPEDPMRRRNLLLFGVAATASLALAPASAEPNSTDPADSLVGLLYAPPPPASGTSLPQLGQVLATARAHFGASRYRDLGAGLPGLIATAEAHRASSSASTRERAHPL
ncbi:multiprotein-bridging factor 1 family protein, partial [Kitasatospora purpeofusca]|uniref:helix-turn-helix domain-containing protein n=1 Tax=Kitasatospora purpeofusca TaxID=67352 RepID=UPI0035DC47C9